MNVEYSFHPHRENRNIMTHMWSKWGTRPGKFLLLAESNFTAMVKRYLDVSFHVFAHKQIL